MSTAADDDPLEAAMEPTTDRPHRKATKAAATFIAGGIKQENIPIRDIPLISTNTSTSPSRSNGRSSPPSNVSTSHAASASKKRNTLCPLAVEYLKGWMMHPDNIEHPYPSEDEKAKIMKDTGLDHKQLTNWFVKNRKRYWKPNVEKFKRQMDDSATATRGDEDEPSPPPPSFQKSISQNPHKGKSHNASLSVDAKDEPRDEEQGVIDTPGFDGEAQSSSPEKNQNSMCVESLLALKNGESSAKASPAAETVPDTVPEPVAITVDTAPEMMLADMDLTSFTNSTSHLDLGGIDTTDLRSSLSMQYLPSNVLLGTQELDDSRLSKQYLPNHVIDGSPMHALAVATQVMKQKDASEMESISKGSSQQKNRTKGPNKRKLPLASNRKESPKVSSESCSQRVKVLSKRKLPLALPKNPITKKPKQSSASTDPERIKDRVTKYRERMKSTEEGYDQLKSQQNLYKRRSRKRKAIKKLAEENQRLKQTHLSKWETDRLKAKVSKEQTQREEVYKNLAASKSKEYGSLDCLIETKLDVDDQLELEYEMAKYESKQIGKMVDKQLKERAKMAKTNVFPVGQPIWHQPPVHLPQHLPKANLQQDLQKIKEAVKKAPPPSTNQIEETIKEKMQGKVANLLETKPKAYFNLK